MLEFGYIDMSQARKILEFPDIDDIECLEEQEPEVQKYFDNEEDDGMALQLEIKKFDDIINGNNYSLHDTRNVYTVQAQAFIELQTEYERLRRLLETAQTHKCPEQAPSAYAHIEITNELERLRAIVKKFKYMGFEVGE